MKDLRALLSNGFGVGDGEVILAGEDVGRVGVLLHRIPLERDVNEVLSLRQEKESLRQRRKERRTTDTLRRSESNERHRKQVKKGVQCIIERMTMEAIAYTRRILQ